MLKVLAINRKKHNFAPIIGKEAFYIKQPIKKSRHIFIYIRERTHENETVFDVVAAMDSRDGGGADFRHSGRPGYR